MFNESNKRSIAKTIAWRFVVFVLDFTIAYFLLKDFQFATGFAVIKLLVATVAYYIHERIWNRIGWGKS